ncbi:MAG: 3-oxoacyl-[acyl-carrier-protein] synthase II [Flammeovirgaceae bacterium]|jgi:3-oxoacyl-[acyl-carrier-protein] synthase II
MDFRRVVVTGFDALTPIGNSAEEFFTSLKEGKSGAAPITKFDASKFKTRFACEVKGFNPEEIMERKEARKMDLFTQYAVHAAQKAVDYAGLDTSSIDPTMAGVILGSGIGGMSTTMGQIAEFTNGDGTPRFNPFFIPKSIIDIAPGMVSMRFGMRGPNYSTVSACASSTNAMIDAMILIQTGRADVIITGGSEAIMNEAGIGGFNALHALSKRNDSPETASRPFDANRDGFVMGEGAGVVILESYEHAKKRGATIYAEILGGGMSADAHHMTAPHPEGLGAIEVMHKALKDAKINPEDVDYVNVHGTSTPLGDIAEVKAILKVFGHSAYKLNISSTKSMTGHLLGAAGAIESLACVMALRDNVVPPTINHSEPDPEIDKKLNLTLNVAQERKVKIAMSNTFGFGGHNASLVFKKFEE